MRSLLHGIITDLWRLRDAYALLDTNRNSPRSVIYHNFRDSMKEYSDRKVTVSQLREALKRAFDYLTGSYIMAIMLICFIAPNDAYQAYYSQEALIDLEEVAKKLDDCLPPGKPYTNLRLENTLTEVSKATHGPEMRLKTLRARRGLW